MPSNSQGYTSTPSWQEQPVVGTWPGGSPVNGAITTINTDGTALAPSVKSPMTFNISAFSFGTNGPVVTQTGLQIGLFDPNNVLQLSWAFCITPAAQNTNFAPPNPQVPTTLTVVSTTSQVNGNWHWQIFGEILSVNDTPGTSAIAATVTGTANITWVDPIAFSPTSVTFASPGAAPQNVTVAQGVAPYSVVNNNPFVASGQISGSTLTVAPYFFNTSAISLSNVSNVSTTTASHSSQTTITTTDTDGLQASLPVTVNFTTFASVTANVPFTSVSSVPQNFIISGGSSSYNFFIYNSSIISVSLMGNGLKITPLNPGATNIVITDSVGNSCTVSVSIAGVPLILTPTFLTFNSLESPPQSTTVTQIGTFSEFAIPTGSTEPRGICLGPDGNVWFTEISTNQIWKITPAGVFASFQLPNLGISPFGICAGPDGNLWIAGFSNTSKNYILAMNTAGQTISQYQIPTNACGAFAICSGPDGNIWFVEQTGNKVGKVTLAGVFTEYAIPTAASSPFSICVGNDFNLWITEEAANKVAKVTTAGAFSEFSLTAAANPTTIVAGPDGNMWFTEFGLNKIGKITTAGAGYTEFATTTSSSKPYGLCVGVDNNLWFAESNVNKIGKFIIATHAFSEFLIPTVNCQPQNVCVGADGDIWFVESNVDKIGTVSVALAPFSASVGNPTVASVNVTGNVIKVSPNQLSGVTNVIISDANTPPLQASLLVEVAQIFFLSPTLVFPFGSTNQITRAISGGSPPYTVFSYNFEIINASIANTIYNTGNITIIPINPGNTNVIVADSASNQGVLPVIVQGALNLNPTLLTFANDVAAPQTSTITTFGTLTEFTLPASGGAQPFNIVPAPDGNMWFTEFNASAIGRITPFGTVTQFSVPTLNCQPFDLCVGPMPQPGISPTTIWFSEFAANKIATITISGSGTGIVTAEFSIPTSNSGPTGICLGPDGFIWFLERNSGKVGRIDPRPALYNPTLNAYFPNFDYGTFTEFGTAGAFKNLSYICAGQSTAYNTSVITTSPLLSNQVFMGPGLISGGWTQATNNLLVSVQAFSDQFSANDGFQIQQTSLPGNTVQVLAQTTVPPNNITAMNATITQNFFWRVFYQNGGAVQNTFDLAFAPSGDLWFSEFIPSSVSEITTNGAITTFNTPGSAHGICIGPEGNVWYTQFAGNAVTAISPYTGQTLETFTLPVTSATQPYEICTGPEQNLWFTDVLGNKVWKVTPVGNFTSFTVPTTGAGPRGITVGTDGNIWFTEFNTGKIGKISPALGPFTTVAENAVIDTDVLNGNIITVTPNPAGLSQGTAFILAQDSNGLQSLLTTKVSGPNTTNNFNIAGAVNFTTSSLILYNASLLLGSVSFSNNIGSYVFPGSVLFQYNPNASIRAFVDFFYDINVQANVSFLATVAGSAAPFLVGLVGFNMHGTHYAGQFNTFYLN